MSINHNELIAPFAVAAAEVFKTMVGVDVTPGKPFRKADSPPAYGVCGIIGFHGQVAGSVVVCFPGETAERLVRAFVGVDLRCGEPDFADAVGELANMIAGCAKGKMPAVAGISTPSVVLGYPLARPTGAACVVIPCQCVHGAFVIEVSIAARPIAA